MSLGNMTQRFKFWEDRYCLAFHDIRGWGYSFDMVGNDEDGFTMVPLDKYQQESFTDAINSTWDTITIENWGGWINNPAHGICACGAYVYLEQDYGHGIDCDGCTRIYNSFGQELAPRSLWDDMYNEESVNPYSYEFGYSTEDY